MESVKHKERRRVQKKAETLFEIETNGEIDEIYNEIGDDTTKIPTDENDNDVSMHDESENHIDDIFFEDGFESFCSSEEEAEEEEQTTTNLQTDLTSWVTKNRLPRAL